MSTAEFSGREKEGRGEKKVKSFRQHNPSSAFGGTQKKRGGTSAKLSFPMGEKKFCWPISTEGTFDREKKKKEYGDQLFHFRGRRKG